MNIKLGFCGLGQPDNFAVKIANFFFTDCSCCLFWRGVAVGFIAGMIVKWIL